MHSTFGKIIENNVEYEILPYQFFLLTFWGIWCPKNWSPEIKQIHSIYYHVIFFLDTWMCTQMLIHFIMSFQTDEFKLLNFFFVSANITAVYKSFKLQKNREVIRSFISKYFNHQWLQINDSEERKIHDVIDLKIRDVTITYFVSMLAIVLLKAMTPLAESNDLPLPVDAWFPYPVEKSYYFWLTYLHQVILGSSAISAHIGVDTLFVGLLLKIIHQTDILKNRLLNYKKLYEISLKDSKDDKSIGKKIIQGYIRHHQRIYRFGRDLSYAFKEILIILVVSSLPNICINVYSLSSYTDNINVQYIATFFSTTSALLQFFIACWYGNEVARNSSEIVNTIFGMDWNELDISQQKMLVFMMTRSSKPISFTIAYVMPMNIDSFIQVMKSSYTAFNLLQQTTK